MPVSVVAVVPLTVLLLLSPPMIGRGTKFLLLSLHLSCLSGCLTSMPLWPPRGTGWTKFLRIMP